MRNPAYRSHGEKNCTNFISQALNAGGWKHASGAETSVKSWWYKKPAKRLPTKNSTSWVNAEDWYRFARNESKRTKHISNINNVQLGDIVHMKYDKDVRMGHLMVVTKKVGTKVYLSYNSTDHLNKPLSEVISGNKGAKFFAHSM